MTTNSSAHVVEIERALNDLAFHVPDELHIGDLCTRVYLKVEDGTQQLTGLVGDIRVADADIDAVRRAESAVLT